MKLRWVVSFGLALAIVGFLFHGARVGVARTEGEIGVIDIDSVWSEKLLPALEEALIAETARLQAELDEAVVGKSETEQQRLFEEYQAQLYSYQQQLVDELLAQVRETIAVVAEELGLSVVLDANGVMYGGVDITEAVLDRLP